MTPATNPPTLEAPMPTDAIATFTTPTDHVGKTPYCAAAGRAVWVKRPQRTSAEAGRQLVAGFEAAYSGSTLPHVAATYSNGPAEVTVIGGRDRFNVVAVRGEEAHTMVVGCECHAREIARHLAENA